MSSCLKPSLVVFILYLITVALFAAGLEAPAPLHPTLSDSPVFAGEIEFEWTDTKANYYQYHINLPDGSSKEEITPRTSDKVYDLSLGNHSWAVRACEDKNAINCSNWSNAQSFQIASAPQELIGGLVPCGREYDNPKTEYINEAKPCQFSDLFLLLKLVLDFVLWKLGLIIIVLLAVLAGLVSYFSFGGPETIVKVKSILKSAITGYIIILLAWLAVNLILRLLGYTLVDWWIISF